MRQRVTEEQIRLAKSVDLISYMKQYEPQELIRTGPHDYKTTTHSSLCISDNGLWHWFSHGVGGRGALNYLIQVKGMDFVSAVRHLCELEHLTPVPFQQTPSPAPTESPEADQVEAANSEIVVEEAATSTAEMSYGALPFDLAAGTQEWWGIDSSDAAYWAVQDNINAMREAGGLPDLTMDSSLSTAADARCESFVAGGPFDHSGMTTASEICASGPLESASAVCTAWQNSPTHYANIMNASFTSMGVGCWFCYTDQGRYTYWVVTFS